MIRGVVRRILGASLDPDPALIEARRRTEASMRQADADLLASRTRAAEGRAVADQLRRHNQANGYARWLEDTVLHGGRS